MKFIGLGRFQGQDRSLTTTIQTATNDERRRSSRGSSLGLVAHGRHARRRATDVTQRKALTKGERVHEGSLELLGPSASGPTAT